MNNGQLVIFTLNASRNLGQKVCGHLKTSLAEHEEREFEDGEHKARPLVNVRGKDVFVIQSLYAVTDCLPTRSSGFIPAARLFDLPEP